VTATVIQGSLDKKNIPVVLPQTRQQHATSTHDLAKSNGGAQNIEI